MKNNRNNSDFLILDVRTPKEFKGEHILGAKNLNYYSNTFRDDLNKLDKNRRYLVYCRSGRRSGIALSLMKTLDFKEVYNVLGGIIAWKKDGLPLTR
jgi:rhodanese-related sulfurtransferase